MKLGSSFSAQVKASDTVLMYYWHVSFSRMSTKETEGADVFRLDEDVFERALEDIEKNPELYDSFSG